MSPNDRLTIVLLPLLLLLPAKVLAASPQPEVLAEQRVEQGREPVPKPSPTPAASPTAAPSAPASPTPAPSIESPSEPPQAETSQPETPQTVEAATPPRDPQAQARFEKLVEADRLYREGQHAAAEKLYREVKGVANATSPLPERPAPLTDPTQLPPGGQVFWREAEAGFSLKLESRIFVPLRLLVEKYPQFVPGHLRLAEALKQYRKSEEALAVLERATTLYPNQIDLVRAWIAALAEQERWLEASIGARQFALLNPQHPEAANLTALADRDLERYKAQLRGQLRTNAIGNILTGALTYGLTGSLFGPLSAIQTTAILIQGESGVGNRLADRAKRDLPLVEDEAVVAYVNEVGNKLATMTGRKDFKYEFYVVLDDDLNAFALPGGKVFVNAGAIVRTNSEAELAGLLAHELSHAVLSHGFQLVTSGNLTANVTQLIPYAGGMVGNLLVLNYSRDMERQADILGTRILASSGYAADGLHNLMVTLKQEEEKKGRRPVFTWLSSHPLTEERIRYLDSLIVQGQYNRYAYEGVERYAAIQARVEKLLKEQKDREAAEQKNRR